MSENWDVYLREDGTGSVLVDLGIAERAPVAHLPYLGLLSVAMKRPRPDGLSSDDEADALYALEDRILPAIRDGERIVYVGRTTGGGTRDFHFYTDDPTRFEDAARAAMRDTNYPHAVSTREDIGWLAYFGELRPSPEALQRMMNRRVLDSLVKQGDDVSVARDIDHFAYGLSKAARAELARRVEAQGFTVTSDARDGESNTLVFVRSNAPEDIDDVVAELIELCKEVGGEYDGWGCPCAQDDG